ncbi:hypothetical protein [Bernardetia sp.]|uniref:hypothetical protein n=1 Tax=Bernardetia sp. TaxID=1937974 RepID=UPI0025C23D37|nr:hypothetical protein [Bernardetia sp.]
MKRGTKITIGISTAIFVLVAAFLAYRYFNKKKGEQATSRSGAFLEDEILEDEEPLSRIEEFAEQGIKEKWTDSINQNASYYEKQKQRAIAEGDFATAEKASEQLKQAAVQVKNLTDPETIYQNVLREPNRMTNKIIADKIKSCQENPSSADCSVFKKTDLAKYLIKQGVI